MRLKETWKKYATIIAFFVILIPNDKSLAGDFILCAQWPTEFTDSGQGAHDWDTTGRLPRSATYAKYKLSEMNANGQYDTDSATEGYLEEYDINGSCTPLVRLHESNPGNSTTPPDGHYLFELCTKLAKEDLVFYVMPQNETQFSRTYSCIGVAFDAVCPDPNTSDLCSGIPATANTGHEWAYAEEANVAALAGRFLDQSETLGLPTQAWSVIDGETGFETYIGSGAVQNEWDTCDGSKYKGEGKVCLTKNAYNSKFVPAHEIGHRIVDILSWNERALLRPDYNAPVDINTEPFCQRGGNSEHSLQEKEYIGTAQNEGWAHFIATVMFNDRSKSDATFVYWATVEKPLTMIPGPTNYTRTYTPPHGFKVKEDNEMTSPKWLENVCVNRDNMGVEWDWLAFYYGLWGTGSSSERFEVSEILDIWDYGLEENIMKHDQKYWSQIEASVEAAYDESRITNAQRTRFKKIGDDAAVNY